MSKATQTETLSLRITAAESLALQERAESEGVSRGTIVRRALLAYGVAPPPVENLYEGIKHIIGRNKDGPTDLSTNPDYLKDYGL